MEVLFGVRLGEYIVSYRRCETKKDVAVEEIFFRFVFNERVFIQRVTVVNLMVDSQYYISGFVGFVQFVKEINFFKR